MREQAKEYICEQIDKSTLEELFDRFWEGRKQYGGAFDVEAIPVRRELKLEAMDVVLYFAMLQLQHER